MQDRRITQNASSLRLSIAVPEDWAEVLDLLADARDCDRLFSRRNRRDPDVLASWCKPEPSGALWVARQPGAQPIVAALRHEADEVSFVVARSSRRGGMATAMLAEWIAIVRPMFVTARAGRDNFGSRKALERNGFAENGMIAMTSGLPPLIRYRRVC